MTQLQKDIKLLRKALTSLRRRWTAQRDYNRNLIPHVRWSVTDGKKIIMSDLTQQSARALAKAHNEIL